MRVRTVEKLKPYLKALPDMFSYQVVTKILLAVWIFLLGRIFQALLKSTGRIAVTSGDFMFLFNTWQGILILIIGLVSLFIYVTFDINAKIVISSNIVKGADVKLKDNIKRAFYSIGKLMNIRGTLVVLYIAFVAPILGFGLSISLTRNFYIPTFITAVIESSFLYSVLAGIAVLVFFSIGIANLFIMHGLVIDDLSVADAGKQSAAMMKENWKDYLKQNVLFIGVIVVALFGTVLLFLILPVYVIGLLHIPAALNRIITIFLVSAGVVISLLVDLMAVPVYILKMTQLYCSYRQHEPCMIKMKEREVGPGIKRWTAIVLAAVIIAVGLMYVNFDQLFPERTKVSIVAHRAGGNEGIENSLSGLESAWKAGAYGSEIDIQRTKDGYYVLNHDSTFKRVAGDDRRPEDVTLREAKRILVKGEPVATLEEMMISAKGRLVLFIELKGNTADRKMAENVVKLVKQYKMEKECVLISLKYDLIDYIETKYPDIETGFLTFASFGKTAELNCDYLALEEESATSDAINAVHKEGKKVLVWTVNDEGSQKHFLCSKADGIITDNVSQAKKLSGSLENRTDVQRMVDKVKTIL